MLPVLAAVMLSFSPVLPSDTTCPTDTLSPLPHECWPGDSVYGLSSEDYLSIESGYKTPRGWDITPGKWLHRETGVIMRDSAEPWVQYISIEGDGRRYVLDFSPNLDYTINGLGFYRDLRYAQDHWVGTKMFIATGGRFETDTGWCDMNTRHRITIVSAEWGEYSFAPIRLRFQDSTGHGCYCDVSVSGTNMDTVKSGDPWTFDFYFQKKMKKKHAKQFNR